MWVNMSNLRSKTKSYKKINDNCTKHDDKDKRSDNDNEQWTQRNSDNEVWSSDNSRTVTVTFEFGDEVSRTVNGDIHLRKKEEEKCEMITYVYFTNITLFETNDNGYLKNHCRK